MNRLKWRLAFEAGENFRTSYLKRRPERETAEEFENRKSCTPIAANAKYALLEQRDMIAEHFDEVTRIGPIGYQHFTKHATPNGKSLNVFMSSMVIPELLHQGKVLIVVDREETVIRTLADSLETLPYVYIVQAENISDVKTDRRGKIVSVKFTRTIPESNETEEVEYALIGGAVVVKTQNNEKVLTGLTKLPIVIADIGQSLMMDICDHQIALLNICSSDVNYAIESNFPFYIEQGKNSPYRSKDDEGNDLKQEEAKVGPTYGRRWQGTVAPDFISPPSENLNVSIKLREDLKADLRQTLQLTMSRIRSSRASGDSSSSDVAEKATGLSAIVLELESCEQLLANIVCEFLGEEEATVKYPNDYTSPSVKDRKEEIGVLEDVASNSTSVTLRRACASAIARLALGPDHDSLAEIDSEINSSAVPIIKTENIVALHEGGLIPTSVGSTLAGFDEKVADLAKADHVQRLKEIAIAQSQGAARAAPGAAAAHEKKVSQL